VIKKLLIIAPMTDGLIEYFETAEALGYSPISVQTGGPLLDGPWEAILASHVSPELWRGPVFVASAAMTLRKAGERVDRFWHSQFLLAKKVADEAGATDFPGLIHPTAHVSPTAKLGQGVFIGPGVTVAHQTSVGDFTHVGRGS